jgi:hypothetical protein
MSKFYYNSFLYFNQNIRDDIALEFGLDCNLLNDIALYYNNLYHDNHFDAFIELDYAINHYRDELQKYYELENLINDSLIH